MDNLVILGDCLDEAAAGQRPGVYSCRLHSYITVHTEEATMSERITALIVELLTREPRAFNLGIDSLVPAPGPENNYLWDGHSFTGLFKAKDGTLYRFRLTALPNHKWERCFSIHHRPLA